MKTLAVIYTRVSSDDQVDNMSLGEQERVCRDFISRHDLTVDKIFVEEGESAKSADRTKLKEMLEYCRENKHKIGHLVVFKVDRFARRVEDHIALQTLLKKMDIVLWSASEPIDKTTTGKLMENVLASFAQFDNDQRSERCRAGMKARALEGGWVTHAPIGYENVKDALKRPTLAFSDEVTVKALRKFFDRFSTGKYRQEQASELAKKCGVVKSSGKYLSRNGAIDLLTNITYAGKIKNDLTDNKTVEGLHPAMIGIEQFKSIQATLAGRKRSYAPPSRFKPRWPLRRFLKCGQCNHALTGSAPTGGSGHSLPAYHCATCTIKRNGYRVSIPKAKAHEEFEARLDSFVPSEWAMKAFKEIVIRRWNNDFRDVQDVRCKLDNDIKLLEERKNELFDRWMAGRVKDDLTYEAQNDRITVQKEALELERAELKSDELDKEHIVDQAIRFMAHAGEIWKTAIAADKVLFQKLVYEAGIPVYPDQSFGTSNLSPIYQQMTEIQAYYENNKAELSIGNSAMVRPIGFEPTASSSARMRSNPAELRAPKISKHGGTLGSGTFHLL